MKAEWCRYDLKFRFEARTSRGAMWTKPTWFVRLTLPGGHVGIGECPMFPGLSIEDTPDFEKILDETCLNYGKEELPKVSSIRFAIESALFDAISKHPATPFGLGKEGIPINGLIWMGDKELMRQRIDEKLNAGFKVLKLKIGGIDFESEVSLLKYIRSKFPSDILELRLDANGSFTPENALGRLEQLAPFNIHSIEQPIKPGQLEAMAVICKESPVDIALDEELIGYPDPRRMFEIVANVCPQYLIIKPALCGGFMAADNWISLAEEFKIGWWATSALESNIGLNAIAQWVANKEIKLPQGLGTGQLYTNNFDSPLELKGDELYYDPNQKFIIPELPWQG